MVVLSDPPDQAESDRTPDAAPTRRAIMDQLGGLARKARAGDQVLIYFSGHGSQQPDTATSAAGLDEADGLDEIILPSDIGPWEDSVGAVRNAISDDEIGRAVDAIRRKGAFVWLVIDACHSGTALRGGPLVAGDQVEIKAVSTAALGIPDKAIQSARTASARLPARRKQTFEPGSLDGRSASMGGVTAFYAASASEAAISTTFIVDGKATPPMGILTYALTQALASGRTQSYRDLALRVQAVFQTPGLPAPQPAFEGDFDRSIMGLDMVQPREWRVRREEAGPLVMDGGWLDGVREGAVFAVRYASTSADPVAYLQVKTVAATSATLMPFAYGSLPDAAAAQISKFHVFAGVQVAAGIPFTVKIGRPPADPNPSAAATLLQNALELIAADPGRLPGVQVELVEVGHAADVYLRSGLDRVWFADQPHAFNYTGRDQPPALVVTGATRLTDFANDLSSRLQGFARARTLMRVMTDLELGEGRKGVSVTYFVQPTSPAASSMSEHVACPAPPRPPFNPPVSAVPLATYMAAQQGLPRLRNCDVVYVQVENSGDQPIDMTPLYFSRDSSITYLESGQLDGVRVPPGKSRTFIFQAQTFDVQAGKPLPLGPEQLAVIVVPQPDENVPPVSYAYLAQANTPRRGGSTPLDRLLDSAGFTPSGLRSANTGGAQDAAVFRSEWIVR